MKQVESPGQEEKKGVNHWRLGLFEASWMGSFACAAPHPQTLVAFAISLQALL